MAYGYSVGSFRVLCHHFRRDPTPEFFVAPHRGPQTQPKKSAARAAIIDSGVRTAGMPPKEFMGTRESRQVQA